MSSIPLPFSNKPLIDWVAQLQQAKSDEDRLQALQAVGFLATPLDVARWAAHSLGDEDLTVRAFAAKLLGGTPIPLSDETEKQLSSLLADADPDVRFESARALIRQKSTQADRVVPVLLAFLDEAETHALMIAAVINAISEIDLDQPSLENELLPRLLRSLDHERAEVREAISIAFAKWPQISKSCTDQLLPLLDDSEPIVREKIAFTIGQAGVVNESIRTALQSTCQDEDTEVARVATEALQLFSSKK